MQTTIRAEPNVTPMIDVMLVQLFIFVVIRTILVRADREPYYARMLDAIDIVRQNGVQVVGMIAETPPAT